MLHIRFGDMEKVNYGPSWFKFNYDPKWLEDSFVQKMIEDVDKTKYMGGLVFDSPVLGPIPPEKLSGGVQTLIMIYEKPDLIFDATSCGDNCAKWLLEIGKMKDVTVNLKYIMQFPDDLNIYVDNKGVVVRSFTDYLYCAVDYV